MIIAEENDVGKDLLWKVEDALTSWQIDGAGPILHVAQPQPERSELGIRRDILAANIAHGGKGRVALHRERRHDAGSGAAKQERRENERLAAGGARCACAPIRRRREDKTRRHTMGNIVSRAWRHAEDTPEQCRGVVLERIVFVRDIRSATDPAPATGSQVRMARWP